MMVKLTVRALLNSSLEEVLGWKCCSLPGMNLEVQVTNRGGEAVTVRSEMELVNDRENERVGYFYPHGVHALGPGEGLSFYCAFPEDRFTRFTHVIVSDREGRTYRAGITGRDEDTEAI